MITYSKYKTQSKTINQMTWDMAWASYMMQDGEADRNVGQHERTRGGSGYHANSRSAKCQYAWERGVRLRLRVLDREATGDNAFCNMMQIH